MKIFVLRKYFVLALFLGAAVAVNSQIFSKAEVLQTLFKRYENTKTLSYVTKFVYAGRTDTAISYQYYHRDLTEDTYSLSFNIATYRFNKLHYQQVYNHAEKMSYYRNPEKLLITDHKKPPKHYHAIDEMLASILTYVKYLEQTYADYPDSINVKLIKIDGKAAYQIKFKNPDEFALTDKKVGVLSASKYPLQLIVDSDGGEILYRKKGYMTYKILNVKHNINDAKIWTVQSIPDDFKEKLVKSMWADNCILTRGEQLPKWDLLCQNNTPFNTNPNYEYYLYVLFSDNCGACVKEIPLLNVIHKTNKIKIIGVYLGEENDKISAFKKKYHIDYDIVFAANKKPLQHVKSCAGFPLNYLTNRNNSVLLSQLGYNQQLEELIFEAIQ